jgi:hypothetical protein
VAALVPGDGDTNHVSAGERIAGRMRG